ncbi:hypothetical protein HYV81_03385 [Candidatus Woesearchaeota archaeon]|nr:hypothetical protein [Candidatus Woesearchaeota archaeon]
MVVKAFFARNREHAVFLSMLIISLLIFYNQFISSERTLLGEFNIEGIDLYQQIRTDVLTYHEFPYWINAWHGGMPFYQHSEKSVVFYTTLIALIFPNPVAGMNFTLFLHAFLLGLFVYLVLVKFEVKPLFAFAAAFMVIYSRFFNWIAVSYVHRYGLLVWLPLLFYFLYKACYANERKKWIQYSLFSGIVLAVQFATGGLDYFIYLVAVFIAVFGVYLFGKNFLQRAKRVALVSAILLIVFLGLSAIRLMPLLDFEKVSSKQGDFTYEQFIGNKINLKSLGDFRAQVLGIGPSPQDQNLVIGITGLALLMCSSFLIRKRIVMTLWVLALLGLLMSTGTYILYPMWKLIPGFSKAHHVHRAAFLFVFATLLLAGIGLQYIADWLQRKYRLSSIKRNALVAGIMVLILFEFWIFPWLHDEISPWRIDKKLQDPEANWYKHLEQNALYQYLAEEKLGNEVFRINNYGTNTVNGFAGIYAMFLNQEILYGSISIWIPEYMTEYLTISNREPAKLWGMLNTKYVYFNQPLNVSGLRLVKRFEECSYCLQMYNVDFGVSGPYLYANEMYLPRAYYAKHAVLLVGNKNDAINAMYSIMLSDFFNPVNTVLIYGGDKAVSDFDSEFLKHVDAIILLSGTLDQEAVVKLQEYSQHGKIFPDVLKGENSINMQDLSSMFASFGGSYDAVEKVEITKYTDNSRMLKTDTKGWLVLSEKFYLFPEWKASYGNEILENTRANGVNTVYYIDGTAPQMEIRYVPDSFRTGMIISIATALAIISYFIWQRFKYRSERKARHGGQS